MNDDQPVSLLILFSTLLIYHCIIHEFDICFCLIIIKSQLFLPVRVLKDQLGGTAAVPALTTRSQPLSVRLVFQTVKYI